MRVAQVGQTATGAAVTKEISLGGAPANRTRSLHAGRNGLQPLPGPYRSKAPNYADRAETKKATRVSLGGFERTHSWMLRSCSRSHSFGPDIESEQARVAKRSRIDRIALHTEPARTHMLDRAPGGAGEALGCFVCAGHRNASRAKELAKRFSSVNEKAKRVRHQNGLPCSLCRSSTSMGWGLCA